MVASVGCLGGLPHRVASQGYDFLKTDKVPEYSKEAKSGDDFRYTEDADLRSGSKIKVCFQIDDQSLIASWSSLRSEAI